MSKKTEEFISKLWAYYNDHARELPWRNTTAPYKILVSEIMLQQTQVSRVIPKYQAFIKQFPDVHTLANSTLADVLMMWSGLGYNRRAKFLHEACKAIVHEYGGKFPQTVDELIKLPGIGKNTAGAIMAYAFNKPVIFIETNIRTVFIHHFFADQVTVTDKVLIPYIKQTIDTKNPREFYWALMDYGTYLKATVGNAAKRSKHYTIQSRFEGSVRQVRGQVLRSLGKGPKTFSELIEEINDERLFGVLDDLVNEKLVSKSQETYSLG